MEGQQGTATDTERTGETGAEKTAEENASGHSLPSLADTYTPTPAQSSQPALEARSTLLRDYSADNRMLLLSAMACIIGTLATLISWALLRLIALSTNIFYFHRLSFTEVEAGYHPHSWFIALGLIIDQGNSLWFKLYPKSNGAEEIQPSTDEVPLALFQHMD